MCSLCYNSIVIANGFSKNHIIIVSNRLPISVRKTETGLDFTHSAGGLATGLSSYTKKQNCRWVGWPGIASDLLTTSDKDKITEKLLEQNYYPVFLTKSQLDGFYNGYSNRVLWPLFHNKTVNVTTRQYDRFWQSYKQVNYLYANAISTICEQNDTSIWVHDYQLMLLPDALRRLCPDSKIGFFLHIPFPEANELTKLKNSKELVSGVLGSKLVGFHIQKYTDNFAQSCRQLGIDLSAENTINFDGRKIQISNFPMGIDYEKFNCAGRSKRAINKSFQLHDKYQNQKVILTVDRLDPAKGLVNRVLAYRKLLSDRPDIHQKVVLVMIATPSRAEIKEYKDEKQQLEMLINSTNQEFRSDNWQPIEYRYEQLDIEDLVPLYQLADIAFIAPLADGMNLVAKEYIASKSDENGILVLSKTAGAAEELTSAVLVDPDSRSSLVKGLATAISMPESDKKKRMRTMKKIVSACTAKDWAENFIKHLSN